MVRGDRCIKDFLVAAEQTKVEGPQGLLRHLQLQEQSGFRERDPLRQIYEINDPKVWWSRLCPRHQNG